MKNEGFDLVATKVNETYYSKMLRTFPAATYGGYGLSVILGKLHDTLRANRAPRSYRYRNKIGGSGAALRCGLLACGLAHNRVIFIDKEG